MGVYRCLAEGLNVDYLTKKLNLDYLTKEQFDGQLKEWLRVKVPARITMDNWFRDGCLHRPLGRGGRGIERKYHPTTAAELYAGMALLLSADGMTRQQIRYIREAALLIEACYTTKDLLAVVSGFTRGAYGRDVSRMGPDIVFWLRKKREAMRKLYGETQPAYEKRRDEYFDSNDFIRVVFGMVTGFYDGWRFEGNKLIKPSKKPSAESEGLGNFPDTPAAISAKGRD